jgi:hypothetical protein
MLHNKYYVGKLNDSKTTREFGAVVITSFCLNGEHSWIIPSFPSLSNCIHDS